MPLDIYKREWVGRENKKTGKSVEAKEIEKKEVAGGMEKIEENEKFKLRKATWCDLLKDFVIPAISEAGGIFLLSYVVEILIAVSPGAFMIVLFLGAVMSSYGLMILANFREYSVHPNPPMP